ncbi:MAG: hypothetical protein AAGJ29_06475, partial [Pseudomonadota bacterium]
MGNRGGRIHENTARVLHPTKRWASRQWICCVTEFKRRQRQLMTPNQYTELFFLDEVTALAAGHRPCFECRRADAVGFAQAWQRAFGLAKRPLVAEMDAQLHVERLKDRGRRTHRRLFADLPDGAIAEVDGEFLVKKGLTARRWTFDGYEHAKTPAGEVNCLTPPAILAAMRAGYRPAHHPSLGEM